MNGLQLNVMARALVLQRAMSAPDDQRFEILIAEMIDALANDDGNLERAAVQSLVNYLALIAGTAVLSIATSTDDEVGPVLARLIGPLPG